MTTRFVFESKTGDTRLTAQYGHTEKAALWNVWAKAPKDYDWLDAYWKSRDGVDRQQVIDHLPPFWSLLELGCNCGPMLAAVHARKPGVKLGGVDISEEAVQECQERVPSALVTYADLMDWLPDQPDQSWDVVLTYFTLAYMEPTDLIGVVEEMLRVGRYIAIAEPTATHRMYAQETKKQEAHMSFWVHNYPGLCADLGVEPQVILLNPTDSIRDSKHVNILTLASRGKTPHLPVE